MKIKETSDAKKFKLYDARGEEIVAEVYVADIEDDIVTGSANQLLNPAFHVPLNS